MLEYFLNRTILGLKSNISKNDSLEFIKSKKGAEEDNIIPDEKGIKKIEKKEQIEEIVKNKLDKLDKVNNLTNLEHYSPLF